MKGKSKKDIKEEMLSWAKEQSSSIISRATDEWDYNESGFDPLVHILAGALGLQLEKVYDFINDTESRLIEKLADYVLPDGWSHAIPGHCIAKAEVEEEIYKLKQGDNLIHPTNENIAFTPLSPITLLDGYIKYFVTEFSMQKREDKSSAFQTRDFDNYPEKVKHIYVGLSIQESIDSIENLTLFFSGENNVVEILKESEWSCLNDKLITKNLPCFDIQKDRHFLPSENLLDGIRADYNRSFITIEDELEFSSKDKIIDFITSSFIGKRDQIQILTDEIKNCEEKIMWLKADLPISLTKEETNNIEIHINHFPVVNLKVVTKKGGDTYFNKSSLNASKLTCNGFFYDVLSVDDTSNDQVAYLANLSSLKKSGESSYMVRHGGMGRKDDYEFWDRMATILSILQDQYKDKEIIEKLLPDISVEEAYRLIENKIDESKDREKEDSIYIIFKGPDSSETYNYSIQYRTCLGSEVNNLEKGINLTAANPSLMRDSIFLVTSPSEGNNPTKNIDKEISFKNHMSQKNGLWTEQDIIKFGNHYFEGLSLKNIYPKVTQKFQKDSRPGFGLTRYYHVEVDISQSDMNKIDNMDAKILILQNKILKLSNSPIPIKVALSTNVQMEN